MDDGLLPIFTPQTRNYFFETESRAQKKLTTANLLATEVIL